MKKRELKELLKYLQTDDYPGLRGNILRCYNVKEKEINNIVMDLYDLNRTRRMFKWSGLPDTIEEKFLEQILQTEGKVVFIKVNDKVYATSFGFGGKQNYNYFPTEAIVSNPYLVSKTYKIDEDCVVMGNDNYFLGFLPLITKYNSLLCENDLTLRNVDVLARAALVFSASDEDQISSAREYIEDLEDGELNVIRKDGIIPGTEEVSVQPGATASAQTITNLIEYHQYLKASKYNEFGLNANWNAKRERINGAESLLNEDILSPLIDDALRCRKEATEKINKMFGFNISVELDSTWKENQEEKEVELDMLDGEKDEEKEVDEDETKEDITD